ncbi:MAG: signal peptidase I [candidate division WWE3 bacterium]|nr:signal peptidase I [candidate division WWE3 bacterium]
MTELVHNIGSLLLDVLEIIVISLTIFVISYIFVFQTHQVIGDSMLPNFTDKEYVLTDKLTYLLFRKPVRGEVVIIKYPKAPEYEYIKRVIGLPGDTLKISDGKVFIKEASGWVQMPEPYIPKEVITFGRAFLPNETPYTVPADNYLVFGDNREVSSDSREWGLVDMKFMVGRAMLRLWPPSSKGLVINDPTYSLN